MESVNVDENDSQRLYFVNREENVLKVSKLLIENLRLVSENGPNSAELRGLVLIVAAQYFGTGKTRFGQSLISEFAKRVEKDPSIVVDLSAKYVKRFLDSITVIVDFRNFAVGINENPLAIFNRALISSTERKLQLPSRFLLDRIFKGIPLDGKAPDEIMYEVRALLPGSSFFIVLDEFGRFIKGCRHTGRFLGLSHINILYAVWGELIHPLMKAENITVYCCGKGAYMPLMGSGIKRPDQISPSNVWHLILKSFMLSDLELILKMTNWLRALHDRLASLSDRDAALAEILEFTAGIPHLCSEVLTYLNKHEKSITNVNDVNKLMRECSMQWNTLYTSPFPLEADPFIDYLYRFVMCLSVFDLSIDKEYQLPLGEIAKRIPDKKSKSGQSSNSKSSSDMDLLEIDASELYDVTTVPIMAIVNQLNCYYVSDPNDPQRIKIVVPTVQRESFIAIQGPKRQFIPIWGPVARRYGNIIHSGNLLEIMSEEMLFYKMRIGHMNAQTFEQVFPFLENTYLQGKRCPFVDKSKHLPAQRKKDNWKEILEDIIADKISTFVTFGEKSKGPDKCFFFAGDLISRNQNNRNQINQHSDNENNIQQEHYIDHYTLLNIQTKNNNLTDIMIKAEIDKHITIIEASNQVDHILLFLPLTISKGFQDHYNSHLHNGCILFKQGETIKLYNKLQDISITLPKNLQVVILTTDAMKQFLHSVNYEILSLKNLDNSKFVKVAELLI